MSWLVHWFKWLIVPTSFTVASDTATVSIWNPYQIEYTITPQNATNQKINWSSSDTTVATVDNKWVVTAVSVWTCIITWVYSYDWTTRTIAVTTAQVAVSWVSLDKGTMRVPMRWNWRLHATVSPANASNKNIIWTSSDTNIATVEWWLVKYKHNWTVTITATTEDWWYTDTCEVTCYTPVAWVSLNYTKLNVPYLHPQTLIATVNPPEAEDRSVTWSSSDTDVATVDSNWVVTYVSNWNAIITCTTTDWWYTANCKVTCYIAVTWITLDNHSLIIPPSNTSQLTATISPSDATNKNVIWTSSNEEIATVDETWLVTHVWIWSCTITATTEDWWFTDTCSVQCIIPVTWVTLNKSSWTVNTQTPLQLTATITPSNATIKTVTWKSSNTSIATVNSSWLVTYVADWTATITCTTTQWWKTATCTVTCTSFVPVDRCFWYTWGQQSITLQPHKYCLEVWWAEWWRWIKNWSTTTNWGRWWYSWWCITLNTSTTLYIYIWWKWCSLWRSTYGTASWWYNWWWDVRTYWSWWAWWWWTDIRIWWNTLYYRRIVAGWWGWTWWLCTWWAWWWICWVSWWCWWWWTQTSWWWSWWWTSCFWYSSWSFWQWWCWSWYTEWWWGGWWWWYGWGWTSYQWWAWWWSWYVYTSATCWNAPSGYSHCTAYFLTNAYTCCWTVSFPSPSWGTETWHSWCWCVRIRSL